MDRNQSENDCINQQLIQEALPSQLDQQQQKQQPNNYTTFFPDDSAQTLAGNAPHFEALVPHQNFASNSSLYIQDQGIITSSSSNNTMNPSKQQHVDTMESNPVQNENEYIYQQYLQMMNNNIHHPLPLDLNLQDYFPREQQPPAIPFRQEQDVFNELLNMASANSLQNNLWHVGQTNPTAFVNNSNNSILTTQQGQDDSYYNPLTANPSNNMHLTLQDNRNVKDDIVLQQNNKHPFANEHR